MERFLFNSGWTTAKQNSQVEMPIFHKRKSRDYSRLFGKYPFLVKSA
jgi:hypothetical protein